MSTNTLPEYKFETGEDKFQSLISQAPMVIATFIGPSFKVETINKMALEIWGKSYEEVINKPLFVSSPELEDGLKNLLTSVFTTGEPFISNEIPVQLKRLGKQDSAYFNFIYQALRDADNKIYGIILIGTEITEAVNARTLKETSELLNRTILESSTDCLKLIDLEGRIEYMNNNGLCQMEVDDFSILKNKYWSSLWGAQNEELVKESVDKALEGEMVKFTAFCPTAKGTPKWWEVTVSPLRNPGEPVQQILSVSRDITEQKRSQEAMEKMASYLQHATDSANVGVWSLDIQTQELEWSALHKKMWGYAGDRTDLIYEDWHKIILPEDKNLAFKQVEDAGINHSFYEVEYRIQRADDNTIRYMRSAGRYYYNDKGEAETLTGISIDITEQKMFTEELEKKVAERTRELYIQNETFKQAEESSGQGSYSFNLSTGKIAYSDNLFRLIGYEPNEFEPSLEEFMKHVHSDDKDFVSQAAQKVLETKMADVWDYRINTKTGAVLNIKGTGRIIKSGDENLLVGTIQDVTKEFELNKELQQKEEYSKKIINNAPDGVILINEESIITLWNPKAEEIFGWKSEEVVGLYLNDIIIPTKYRKAHKEGMKRFLKTGETNILNKTIEITALNKEGNEFHISLTISQATQYGNKLFIAFVKDITVEKENKDELILKTKQLEEINKTLDRNNIELETANGELKSFSYMASHDLQEPLRAIKLFSRHIIDAEKLSDKTQVYFNHIITSSERMHNLIVSLIDFSRVDRADLDIVACDLNNIVEEAKGNLHVSIIEKQAIIEYENLPAINGMCIQLSQLFTNLISNAIKYSRPEIKPHIKITSERIHGKEIDHPAANKQQEYYAIKIADNGIGFKQEYAAKIFEAFKRLHGRSEYSGTGIGLSIVKKIVTNHNGFIAAEGKPGIGSTFTIYLPTS